MDGIRIEVTGNIARVTERPARITSGTVGLPVSFTFDSQWEGLYKTAVFQAGEVCKIVERADDDIVVPWEVLAQPGAWLSIGAYGVNHDGSVAIPTIWVNVCGISHGANPDGDPSTDPTLPVYKQLMIEAGNPADLKTNTKENFVAAINEIYDQTAYARTGIVVDDKAPTTMPILWFNTAPD
jgi:hypothetical protein